MSRATRQRDSISPSLFPFLAVLLCTMGALVLILMLIVSGAQASALLIAEESDKQVEEVASQLELASHGFQKQLAEGRIELEKKRLALQHLENHIQEIIAELEKLQRTGELAVVDKATDEAAKLAQAAAISELEKQLLEAREKLKQKLDKPDGDKPIFAIIPYDGPHGTHRRPIYLECVEEGIRIQPQGVLVRIGDLEPPYGPGNPLDAALRTIRAHYVPANHAVTSTAYPLLVVRPSGIRSYAMARAAMSGWDDQFGYELVGQDLELTYPEGEPGLAQKIVQSLDLARQRQAALIMAMPQKYREFADRDGSLTGSGGIGGIPDAGSATGNYAGGYGNEGTASGDGWNGDGQSANTSSRGGWADGQIQSQVGQTGSASGNNLGFGGDPALALDFDAAQADSASKGNFATNSVHSTAGNSGEYGAGGAPGDSFFGSSGSGTNNDSDRNSSSADAPMGQTGGQAGNGTSGNTNSSHNSLAGGSADGSAGGSGGASSANLAGSKMSVPLNAPNASGSAASNSFPSSSSAAGSAAQGASQDSRGSSNPSTAGASNSSSTSAEQMDGQGMPQISVNQTLNSQRGVNESTTPVSVRKGRGWAWSQGPPSQTTIVRSIRMQCLVDRWVILPDSGKSSDPSVTIPFEDSPQQRAEKLAKVVADRVDQWGMALTGGSWKPILEVDVAPNAQWRFNQLQQLLAGSGLEIQRSSGP